MSSFDFNRNSANTAAFGTSVSMDAGLRAHMLRVYNYMTLGLGISGLLAYVTATTPALRDAIIGTPLAWVFVLAPLGFVLFLSFRIQHMSAQTAKVTFFIYSAITGVSLASIFLIYTNESVFRVFLITAGMFAATSLYGYTTRNNFTGMGEFLFMGAFGIFIASVANFFIHSTALQFTISIIGVLVFAGLTAYQTNRIKLMYSASYGAESNDKMAIMGALSLYLDFVNMFMFMLRLMGNGRR